MSDLFSAALFNAPADANDAIAVVRGGVDSLFLDSEVARMRTWMGEKSWTSLSRLHRHIRLQDGPLFPVDKSSTDLVHAVLLAAPRTRLHGPVWVVGGTRERCSGEFVLEVVRPFYADQTPFMAFDQTEREAAQRVGWTRQAEELAVLLRGVDLTIEPVLGHAVIAYRAAVMTRDLAERVAAFVRAAEVLLAPPKSGGAAEFRRRALLLHPNLLDQHLYLADFRYPEEALKIVYEARTDYVHGKFPFAGLEKRSGATGTPYTTIHQWIPRCELLAETLARATILRMLRMPDRGTAFASREELETAWGTNRIVAVEST